MFLALVFGAGAAYNALVTLRSPTNQLARLVDLSPVPVVHAIAARVAMLQPAAFVTLVILFEATIALSMFLRVPVRRRPYAASLLFFVLLMPVIGWYAVTNVVWAIPALLLLRYDAPIARRIAP